jgi:tetratricopeptide (TPR) repeat protein
MVEILSHVVYNHFKKMPEDFMFSFRVMVFSICLLFTCTFGNAADKEYQKLYRQGVEANKKGDLEDAIRLYSKAISLKPDSAPLYFVRGRAYRMRDQLDKAISDLTRAITLKPNYAEAYNHRGVAYIGKGDDHRALMDFRKACDFGSRDACTNVTKLSRTK